MYLKRLKRRAIQRLSIKKSDWISLRSRSGLRWQRIMAVSLLGLFVITGLTAVLPSTTTLASNDRERAAFVIGTRIDLNSLTVRDSHEAHVDIVPEGAPAVGGPIAEPVTRPTTYTIQKGDTLSEIAISFGLSSYDLLAVNEGLARNQIKPGQEIVIPTTAASEEVVTAMRAKEEADAKKASTKAVASSKSAKATDSGSSSFRVPMSYKMISQYFGEGGHTGVDYAGAEGTPIYATGSGCIIHKASGWNGGYGNVIIQSLPGNKSALYGHLSKFAKLSVGDCVEQGDLIGYNGNTGRSTGPHLHFEIRVNGRPVNPLPYLKR